MTIVFRNQQGDEVEHPVQADVAPRVGDQVYFGAGFPETHRYEVVQVTHSYFRRSGATVPRMSMLECVVRPIESSDVAKPPRQVSKAFTDGGRKRAAY